VRQALAHLLFSVAILKTRGLALEDIRGLRKGGGAGEGRERAERDVMQAKMSCAFSS
jgi:hypothetical protein